MKAPMARAIFTIWWSWQQCYSNTIPQHQILNKNTYYTEISFKTEKTKLTKWNCLTVAS